MDSVFHYKQVGFLGFKNLLYWVTLKSVTVEKLKSGGRFLAVWFYSSFKFLLFNFTFRIQSGCMSATFLRNS